MANKIITLDRLTEYDNKIKGLLNKKSDSTHTHSEYLTKTTYEYNKEIAFGSSGLLYIGAFPMYDSNITVEINSTTSTTYHGVLIIATQNINTTGGGTLTATVYGDASNTIAPNIYIGYSSGSNLVHVYFVPASWSKNLIHIQCQALAGEPQNVCTSVSSVPSTANRKPTNVLTSNYATITELNGKANSTHTHDYLPLSGGTISGTLTVSSGDMISDYIAVKSAGHETGSYSKIATLSSSGYIRYRTQSEILSDIGALPLAGGKMTGTIKFQSNSMPQKYLKYLCGIDPFDSGGELGYCYVSNAGSAVQNLGWTDADRATTCRIPTINLLAYWNGAYANTSSNLTYCKGGTIANQTWVTDNFSASTHTHSDYLSKTSGGTISNNVTLSGGKVLQLNTLKIPTSSNASSYGVGASGQVLMSNGSTVYWGSVNSGGSSGGTTLYLHTVKLKYSTYNRVNLRFITSTSQQFSTFSMMYNNINKFVGGSVSGSSIYIDVVSVESDGSYIGVEGRFLSDGNMMDTEEMLYIGSSDDYDSKFVSDTVVTL